MTTRFNHSIDGQRLLWALMLVTVPVAAMGEEPMGDWAQWRGPQMSGVATEASPPIRWSESENLRWKIAVPGVGSSTPIVWKERVYVATAVKTDRVKEGSRQVAEQSESAGRGNRCQRRDRR